MAVRHARRRGPRSGPGAPHGPAPFGKLNPSQMMADYSADASIRAVDLLHEVLVACIGSPKPQDRRARDWAEQYGPSVRSLETSLRMSPDRVPLVIFAEASI